MENIDQFISNQMFKLYREMQVVSRQKTEQIALLCRAGDMDGFRRELYRATRIKEATYQAAADTVRRSGYTVKHCPLPDGAQGAFSPTTNIIQINIGHHAGVRASLLLHEWAHGILHRDIPTLFFYFNGGPFELEAESVAYIVGKALGIHNYGTVHYLRSWGQEQAELFDPVHSRNIRRAAYTQIEALMVAGLC